MNKKIASQGGIIWSHQLQKEKIMTLWENRELILIRNILVIRIITIPIILISINNSKVPNNQISSVNYQSGAKYNRDSKNNHNSKNKNNNLKVKRMSMNLIRVVWKNRVLLFTNQS